MLNLDCDHYINNSKAAREAMCFLMDPQIGKKVCYVQFPQRFDGIDKNDRYANRNSVFFDVSHSSKFNSSKSGLFLYDYFGLWESFKQKITELFSLLSLLCRLT